MKSIFLSLFLCFTAFNLWAQSSNQKDSTFVIAPPANSSHCGSVLVADSLGHAKWEQPGYVKTDSTFTISEYNKLVVGSAAHIKGMLRIGLNSIYVGEALPLGIANPLITDREDIISTDGAHGLQINPNMGRYGNGGGWGVFKFPANTLINPDGGLVGIGTRTPDAASKLDVNGLLKTTSLRIPGGLEGKVLTSDNAGLARWESLSNLSGNNYWYKNGNSVGTPASVVIGQNNVSASAPLDLKTQSNDKVLIGNGGDASISFIPFSVPNGNSWFHIHHAHNNSLQISDGGLPGQHPDFAINNQGQAVLGVAKSELNNVGLDVRSGGGRIVGNALYFWGSGRPENELPYARLVEDWGIRFASPDDRWVLSTGNTFLAGYSPGGKDWGKGNIFASGNIGVGTTDTKGFKLAVNGKILSKGLKVQMEGWSDFVFDDKYKVATLEETEKYILKHKHLKDVPSEKEVLLNGIEVGEMNKILLQKIEELTLQLIEVNKKVNQLQSTTSLISK